MLEKVVEEVLVNSDFTRVQGIALKIGEFSKLVGYYNTRFSEEVILSDGDGSDAIRAFFNETRRDVSEVTELAFSINEQMRLLSPEGKAKALYLIPREVSSYVLKCTEFLHLLAVLSLGARENEVEKPYAVLRQSLLLASYCK